MNTTTRHTISTLALATALLGAGSAHAAPPSITTDQVDEGQAFVLPISARCDGPRRCNYDVTTESGTATAGIDFTPATAAGTVRKGGTFTTTLTVPAIDDQLAEGFETFTVKVTMSRRGKAPRTFTATQSITASDAPDPAPAPAPAPAPPAEPEPAYPPDSGSPAFTSQALTNGVMRECRTPFWVGKAGAFGAWGNYNAGCEMRLFCPTTYQVCSVRTESAINSERSIGQRVTMNSRISVFSASGARYWHRDKSCDSNDWCRTEDTVNIRSGESALLGCNGVHASGPRANRSSVRCTLTVEKLH